jgi:hypothetical protein
MLLANCSTVIRQCPTTLCYLGKNVRKALFPLQKKNCRRLKVVDIKVVSYLWPSESYVKRFDGKKYSMSGRELDPFIDLHDVEDVVGPFRCAKTGRFTKAKLEKRPVYYCLDSESICDIEDRPKKKKK